MDDPLLFLNPLDTSMNFPTLLFVVLFCGFYFTQSEINDPETGMTSEIQSCFPDMCNLLKEFGAMREKLGALENKQKESENQITELKNKGKVKLFLTFL